MAKVCHSCGKGPAFGQSRSHSMVATKRRFDPNLQKVRIQENGRPLRAYVCTRCLKAGKVTKAAERVAKPLRGTKSSGVGGARQRPCRLMRPYGRKKRHARSA